MTTYRIASDRVRAGCIAEISCLPVDSTMEVTIKEAKKDRSQAQRRLGHMWHGEVSKQRGESHDQTRNLVMLKLAVPIFYRDNICVNGVYSADTLDIINQLKLVGSLQQYHQLMRGFVSGITTGSFSVKQNAEFLTNYENLAIQEGWALSIPDDLRGCY